MGIKLPKIDLNPFDDPGGPLEIDLGDIDLLDWEIDLNPFDAGELLEVDLVDSVENIVTAIEEDPIGTLGTVAMTMAGMPPWAISLVQGANTVAQGGSIEDAVKGMVLTYAGAQLGDIAGNQANKALQQLTNQAGGNLINPAVANAIGAGSKNAAISLVHGKSPQEIANSFLMGNVSAGVGSVLGKIDDSLGLDGTAFEDLSSGVQDAVTAGVVAAIEGGDVTAEAITGLVKGYGQAVIPVAEKLQTSMGLNERQATLITDALGRSMQSAFEGGDPTDAFFESFRVNAEKEMKDWVNSPEGLNINRKLDDLFNNTPELEEKAETMNEAGGAYVKASEDYEAAIDNYNRAVTGNNFIANEEKRLLDEYNRLKGIYNDTNDETTYNAAITAQNNLTTYIAENKDQAAQYQADIATYKPIYDAAKTAYESTQTTYIEAKSEYDKATNFVLSDIDDLGDEFKPIISAADMAVATAIRPTFDPEEYKRVLQLEADENAATHYLSNQADGDAAIAASIAGQYQDVILQLKNGDIDKLPDTLPGLDTRVDKYGRPTMPFMPGFEGKPGIDTGQDGLKQGSPLTKQLAFELGYSLDLEGDTLQLYDLIELNKKGFFVNQLDLERAKLTEYEYGEDYNPKDDLVSINAIGEMSNDPVDTAAEVAAVNESNAQRIRDAAANITYEEYQNMSRSELEAAGLGERPIDRAAAFGMYNWKDYFKGGVKTPEVYDNLTDAQKLEFAMTGSISDGTNLTEMFMDTSTGRAVAAALSAGGLQELEAGVTGDITYYEQFLTGFRANGEYIDILKEKGLSNEQLAEYFRFGTLPADIDITEEDAMLARARTFAAADPNNPGYLSTFKDIISDSILGWADVLDTQILTPDEKEALKYAYMEGKYPADFEVSGTFDAWTRNTLGEAAGELPEVIGGLLSKNPVMLATLGILGAGEAISGAEETAEATVALLSAEGRFESNPEYQNLLNNVFNGDVSQTNKFFAKEVLFRSFEDIAKLGFADAAQARMLHGVKANNALGAISAGSSATEFFQGMLETPIVIDAVNEVFNMELDPLEDAFANGIQEMIGGKVAETVASSVQFLFGPAGSGEYQPDALQTPVQQAYVGLLNNLASWGAISSNPADSNATELVSTLSGLGFDTDTIADIGNVAYNNDFVTKAEISNTLKTINPAFNPTEELSEQAYEQFGGNKSQEELDKSLETFIDPYYFDRDEIKAAAAAAGVTLTDEQIDDYEGQKDEEAAAAEAAEDFDSMYLDIDEVKAAAEAEGITLTDEQAAAYVGQKDEAAATAAIREEYDPQATKYEEAKEFFTELGFTPTRDQVLRFVGATSEEEQQAAVAEFVDPLYTDAEEAREFLESLGYTPTDAEVQRFTGQVRETQQEEAVGEYVDPRLVDADEVKAAYEALGLARPTDNDIQELVGQYMESELAGKAEEYLPTARYNSIINILDNFTGEVGVSDEMQEALDIVKKDMIDALGDLGLEVAAIDQTVDNLTEAVGAVASGDVEATGLYGYIDTAIQELKEAGLTNEEVEATIGSVVGSPATVDADGNEVAATGIYATIADIGETVDNLNDLSTDDVENIVTEAIGKLENISAEDVGTIVDEIVGAPATDDAEATGLYATIGDLNNISTEDVTSIVTEAIGELENISAEDVENVVNGIVGVPATDDAEATGLYATLDSSTNEILDILGNPATDDAEATGIYGYIDSAVDSLGTDLSTLAGNVGTPAEYDEDGNVTAEATGIYAQLDDLMSQGMTNAEAIATLAADFGVAVTDLTNLFNETTGEISEDIGAVAGDVSDIAGLLGEPAVTDNPLTEEDESKDPTGLFGIIAGYEAAGQERDEAIKSAVGDLAIQLGTTEQNILDQMGLDYRALTDAIATSEAGLTEKIETVESSLTAEIGDVETSLTELINKNDGDVDAALAELATALGTTETNILAELGTTKDELTESFTTAIGDVEASLGADIDAVADLIGKPAREVTQTDIDFVIDLIAQENVSQELITQYDVTGDGIIDINDQTLLETALQGGDVTLADTSMFTPATGIYSEIDANTDAITDMITDLNTQIDTKINTQTQQQNVNDLANMLMQADDIGGRRVDVKTPDALADITPYSFESIFRDQGQAQKFVSPYGTARVPTTRPANNPAGPLAFASGFAEGGQVEDENDMLLRILGDM